MYLEIAIGALLGWFYYRRDVYGIIIGACAGVVISVIISLLLIVGLLVLVSPPVGLP